MEPDLVPGPAPAAAGPAHSEAFLSVDYGRGTLEMAWTRGGVRRSLRVDRAADGLRLVGQALRGDGGAEPLTRCLGRFADPALLTAAVLRRAYHEVDGWSLDRGRPRPGGPGL